MIKLHFGLRFHFLRLLDKSSPASKVTGTASTEISAAAPVVMLLFFVFVVSCIILAHSLNRS
jgi:hypothetical protein